GRRRRRRAGVHAHGPDLVHPGHGLSLRPAPAQPGAVPELSRPGLPDPPGCCHRPVRVRRAGVQRHRARRRRDCPGRGALRRGAGILRAPGAPPATSGRPGRAGGPGRGRGTEGGVPVMTKKLLPDRRRGSTSFLLLEWVTAVVLVLVLAALGWMAG